MNRVETFTIRYKLHGKPKTFVVRTHLMSNSEAWHWACCDAGVAPIPKPGRPPLKKFSKPMAERYGVSEVRWRESASVEWPEDLEP